MTTKKVSAGQMWKSEQTGEVFVVTSLYRDVLASFAMLRAIHSAPAKATSERKLLESKAVGSASWGSASPSRSERIFVPPSYFLRFARVFSFGFCAFALEG